MAIGYQAMLAQAEQEIERLSLEDALAHFKEYEVIDLRDVRELQREGKIEGAQHVPRGMLEFWIDPESPYHSKIFEGADQKKYLFYCSKGWRSALATQTAQRMGLNVRDIVGGFTAWREAEGPTEACT
jgi:rhodanese-related sulfurtransferase